MITRYLGFRHIVLAMVVCLVASLLHAESASAQSSDGYFSGITSGLKSVTNFFTPSKPEPPGDDPVSLSTQSTPSPKLYMHVAEMFVRSGKPELAEAHYMKALELEPENLDARLELARLQSQINKKDQAMQNYTLAAKMHPNTPKVFNNLGAFYAQEKLFPEAIAAFGRAIEIDPKDPRARNNIAIILIEMNRLPDAFHQLSTVHDEAVAYYNIGFILYKKGELELSRRHFVTAVSRNPGFSQAQAMIVQIDRARGVQQGSPMQNAQSGSNVQGQQSLGAPQSGERPWWQRSGSGPVAQQQPQSGLRMANIPQPPQQQATQQNVAPRNTAPQNVVRSLPPLSRTDFGPVQATPAQPFAGQVQGGLQHHSGTVQPQRGMNPPAGQFHQGGPVGPIRKAPQQELFPNRPAPQNFQPQGTQQQYHQPQPQVAPQNRAYQPGQPIPQPTPSYNYGAEAETAPLPSNELKQAPMPPTDLNILPASYLSEQ